MGLTASALKNRLKNGLVHLDILADYQAVHPEQVRIFKAMPPSRKLELAANIQFAARELKRQGVRMQHPNWTEEQVRSKVRELFLYAAS